MVVGHRTFPHSSPPSSPKGRRYSDFDARRFDPEAKSCASFRSRGSKGKQEDEDHFQGPFHSHDKKPRFGRSQSFSGGVAEFLQKSAAPRLRSPRKPGNSSLTHLQVDDFVQIIREEQLRGFQRVEVAIQELEHRMCMMLGLTRNTMLPLQEIGETGVPAANDLHLPDSERCPTERSGQSSPTSPREYDNFSANEPSISEGSERPSDMSGSVHVRRVGSETSLNTDKSVKSRASRVHPRRSSLRKTTENSDISGPSIGLLSSKLSSAAANSLFSGSTNKGDANISDFMKLQADQLMRDGGLLNISPGEFPHPVQLRSSGVSAKLHIPDRMSTAAEVAPVERRRTSRDMNFGPTEKVLGRRESCNSSCSLESLRRQSDLELAKSGLNQELEPFSANSSLKTLADEALDPIDLGVYESSIYCSSGHGGARLQRVPWILFRVCGIIPWSHGSKLATCYSLFLFFFAITVIVYPTIRIAQGKMVSTHLCTLPFAVSGLLAALSLRRGFTDQLFTQFPGPLEIYSLKHGFAPEFLRGSLQQFAIVFAHWFLVVFLRGVAEWFTLDACSTEYDSWAFATFLTGSVIYSVLLYCQLHVICMLGMMVDRYCGKLFLCPDSSQNVLEWNLIQAMLRQIADAFDLCFMITQTGAGATLLLVGTQIFILERLDGTCDLAFLAPVLLPPVLLALGAFLVFFKAASVSEKCSRVPPLVNAMSFSDKDYRLDSRRMHTVHFLSSSHAGFYIQEVRITASMAMKLMYLLGFATFALGTKLATDRNI